MFSVDQSVYTILDRFYYIILPNYSKFSAGAFILGKQGKCPQSPFLKDACG